MGRACKTKEDTMTRIITPEDLQGRSLTELQALYRTVHEELVRSDAHSLARQQALASLEAISLAMAMRHLRGPGL
jgi:hypothetical protein